MRFLPILLILPMTVTMAAEKDGAAKSVICSACHGELGMTENEIYPNLAGQNGPYIEKQLRAFRSGERNDPVMSPMAASLSDSDIQTLAVYYSNLK